MKCLRCTINLQGIYTLVGKRRIATNVEPDAPNREGISLYLKTKYPL